MHVSTESDGRWCRKLGDCCASGTVLLFRQRELHSGGARSTAGPRHWREKNRKRERGTAVRYSAGAGEGTDSALVLSAGEAMPATRPRVSGKFISVDGE